MLVVTSISALLCLVGLATPGWATVSIFSAKALASTAALSIISLLLLLGCIALAVIIMRRMLQYQYLPQIFVSLLIVTSLFLLGTFTSFNSSAALYSYNLMISAFSLTYLTSILGVYWLFGMQSTNKATPGPKIQPQTDVDF